MKLTLEQLKENFLNDFIIERTELYSNNDGTIDNEEKEDLDSNIEEIKNELSEIKTLKDMVRLFDDERFESWDVHGMIEYVLRTCVK
jgi:DNA-binding transcriptional regulator GbsR (MarR family)